MFKKELILNSKTLLLLNNTTKRFRSNEENLRGIFPTLPTPFKHTLDEQISFKDLEKNLTHWSSIPFSGYVLHGYYGEYPYLASDEKIQVVKFIRNFVGKEKTIIAGSSSESVKKTLNLLEAMKSNGANYSLLFTPHYYKKQMTYSALYEYFIKVADRSPLPIILHNMPSVTFIDLPADFIIDLAEHPNIVGLKECSHNIAKIACICELVKEKKCSFSVLTGSASFLLDALRVGATGSINALANVLGNQIIELYNLFLKEKVFHDSENFLNDMFDKNIFEKNQLLQNNLIEPDLAISELYGVPGLKKLLDAYGYYGGPCRLPLLDLREEETKNLKNIFLKNGFEWPKFDQSTANSKFTSTV